VRLRAAAAPDETPDLVGRVLDRARPPRLGRGGWLRPALVWVAIVLAVQSAPGVVFGEVDGASTHVARHLGAFALALAVGLLYVAWRPHRAFGLLPFAAALVVALGVGALLDILADGRSALAELVHLTELVGLWLLWMIAGSPGWERVRPHGRVPHATS
jgi:predicted anti-sigma-YlaC factor YlaD